MVLMIGVPVNEAYVPAGARAERLFRSPELFEVSEHRCPVTILATGADDRLRSVQRNVGVSFRYGGADYVILQSIVTDRTYQRSISQVGVGSCCTDHR